MSVQYAAEWPAFHTTPSPPTSPVGATQIGSEIIEHRFLRAGHHPRGSRHPCKIPLCLRRGKLRGQRLLRVYRCDRVMSFAEALKYFFYGQALAEVRRRAREHRRADGTWTDGVHANIVGSMIERKGSSQTVNCSLGSGIRRHAALARMALHGGDVDDRSATPFLHFRNTGSSQQIDTGNIDQHAVIPGIEVCFNDSSEGMNARRIDNDVETSE